MVEHAQGNFAVLVGHVENGRAHPFECWVMGDQPRGPGAVAKTLSMDMRSMDRAYLCMKLDALAKTIDNKHYALTVGNTSIAATSASSVLAQLVKYRIGQLGSLTPDDGEATSVMDSLIAKKEPAGRAGWHDVLVGGCSESSNRR